MSLTSLERFFINVPYSHNGVEMGSICPVNNIEGASVITMFYLCWKEEVLYATSITEKKTVSMGYQTGFLNCGANMGVKIQLLRSSERLLGCSYVITWVS